MSQIILKVYNNGVVVETEIQNLNRIGGRVDSIVSNIEE